MLNQSFDAVLQALVDPTRRRIVERLTQGSASVSELARPLDASLPLVMHHLSVLEECGLVASSKVGRVRSCELRTEPLREVEAWFGSTRAAWERRLDRLGGFLDETAPDAPADHHQEDER